jgi:hypothetical protein
MFLVPTVLVLAALGVGGQLESDAGASLVDRIPAAVDRIPAEDGFRVESAVYVGDDPRPAGRITTIFSDHTVYDCTTFPAETVVFDPAAGRFVLLSEKYHRQTDLTTADLKTLTDRLREVAAKSSDPMARFLAEPKFKEEFDQAAGELTLISPLVTYDVMLADEPNPAVVEQYRGFYDWSARLNAVLAPAGRPPFARLKLNAAIAGHHATASRVYLIVSNEKNPKAKRETIHTDHRIVRPLTPPDKERIAQIRESMTSFNRISFDQYRKLDLQ